MKNKLLITTALVALVSASNAYADALNIADGDTHKITANETVDSLEMTGGSLTGAADVEASVNVSGGANISGGSVSLNGNYDEDTGQYIEIGGNANISGDETKINLNGGSAIAVNGRDSTFAISGGNTTLTNHSTIHGVTEITDGEIYVDTQSHISGNEMSFNGGKISLNNGSDLRASGDINISGETEINMGKDTLFLSETQAFDGVVNAESDQSINISGGTINLNDNAQFIRGIMNRPAGADEELMTENIDAKVKGNINMAGGTINMNGTSSIGVYTSDGKLALDGSGISGSSAEELLAKAPTINVNGNNAINSDIDIKDGLININKGATLTSGDINLTSGNYASIIDLAGTLNANVIGDGNTMGSDKSQMTVWDANAKVKGTVEGLTDLNIRSDLSLSLIHI